MQRQRSQHPARRSDRSRDLVPRHLVDHTRALALGARRVPLTLAAVAVYVLREQPIYAAKLTVRIDRTPNPIPDAQAFAPAYDYRVDPLASEQQVIKSLTISTRTALALGLSAHLTML